MQPRPASQPTRSSIRITTFYEELDTFGQRLRERGLGHWADCLGEETSKSSYVGDAVLRSSHVLKAIETRYSRSGIAREARRLLDECDALWRGDLSEAPLERELAQPHSVPSEIPSPSLRWPRFAHISPLRPST